MVASYWHGPELKRRRGYTNPRTAPPAERLERQAPTVIKGVVVAEAGPFVDGRGQFTLESLQSIVERLAENDRLSGGTKVHFGHVDSLGSHVGRIKGARLSSTVNRYGATVRCVRADLHINAAAAKSPQGDLLGYITTLAEHDEKALGLSLVIAPRRVAASRGEPDIWLAEKITAADLVDEGAATSSLLAAEPPRRLQLAMMAQVISRLKLAS